MGLYFMSPYKRGREEQRKHSEFGGCGMNLLCVTLEVNPIHAPAKERVCNCAQCIMLTLWRALSFGRATVSLQKKTI